MRKTVSCKLTLCSKTMIMQNKEHFTVNVQSIALIYLSRSHICQAEIIIRRIKPMRVVGMLCNWTMVGWRWKKSRTMHYEWDWWLQWTIVDRSQAHTHDSHTWSLLWIAWWLPEYFIRWNHNFVIRRVRAICKRMANRKYNEHISLSRSSASVVIILQSQWNDGINTQCHQNTWFPLLSGAHALRHAPEMDGWLMFVRTPWNACKYAISKWHNLDAFASVANTSVAKTHALRPNHTVSF